MKQSTNAPVQSLLWVEIQSPKQAPFWARNSRLLSDADPAERAFTLAQLKSGNRFVYETSGISFQCRPMNRQEKKRLAHLLSFEAGGYQLDTFRPDSALYVKDGQHYNSMNELVERGFLPQPTIALNPLNGLIKTLSGHLVDVFVPLGQARANFTPNSTT